MPLVGESLLEAMSPEQRGTEVSPSSETRTGRVGEQKARARWVFARWVEQRFRVRLQVVVVVVVMLASVATARHSHHARHVECCKGGAEGEEATPYPRDVRVAGGERHHHGALLHKLTPDVWRLEVGQVEVEWVLDTPHLCLQSLLGSCV